MCFFCCLVLQQLVVVCMCQSLDYNDAPDYAMLQSLLWQCQQRKAVSDLEPFDWEEKEGNELDAGVVLTTRVQTTAEYVVLCCHSVSANDGSCKLTSFARSRERHLTCN